MKVFDCKNCINFAAVVHKHGHADSLCIVSTTSDESCSDSGTLCPGVFTPGLNKLSSCAEVLRLCTVRLGGFLLGGSCITSLLTICDSDCYLVGCERQMWCDRGRIHRLRQQRGHLFVKAAQNCNARDRQQGQTSAFYKIESCSFFGTDRDKSDVLTI